MEAVAIDLFCGIGGLTYGIEQSGITVIKGIDLDGTCKETYNTNTKSDFLHQDIKAIKGVDLVKFWGKSKVKILMGCAPCQPFSSHRKDKKNRKGHKDWGLLNEFKRLIIESEPEIVSMENVPALQHEEVFLSFVKVLEHLGYFVNFSVHNAVDFGVAQRRKRLLLLASKLGEIKFIAPTHVNNKVTVREVIGQIPPIKAGEISNSDQLHRSSNLSEKNIQRITHSTPGGTWKDWPEELVLECHKKESGKSYSSVYGRMRWDQVAPTITTQFYSYGTGRFGHPEQNRALSLREGALLQSFPLDYKFIFEDTSFVSIARHIGNAVPPRLGEIIGKSIQKHLTSYL